MEWMYDLFEWTWHLGKFGNAVWGIYLGINCFAWLFIPLYLSGVSEERHWFRNTFGVWFAQLILFFAIGVIGYLL